MSALLRLAALTPLVLVILYAAFLLCREAAKGSPGAELLERIADERAIADDVDQGRS